MFSTDDLKKLVDQLLEQLNQDSKHSTLSKSVTLDQKNNPCHSDHKAVFRQLSPQKIFVILGLISGALEVRSILIDRDQLVQLIIEGSLKRKTSLDKMLDQIGKMPFDDVLKALMGRY